MKAPVLQDEGCQGLNSPARSFTAGLTSPVHWAGRAQTSDWTGDIPREPQSVSTRLFVGTFYRSVTAGGCCYCLLKETLKHSSRSSLSLGTFVPLVDIQRDNKQLEDGVWDQILSQNEALEPIEPGWA